MNFAKTIVKKVLLLLLPKPAYYRLARFYRTHIIRKFEPRVVEHVYGGYPMKLQLRDAMGAGWYDSDWPLPPEMRLFMGRSLKPGARVFELGAHQGVVAMMLAKSVEPGGHVVAVEADPWTTSIATENVQLNQISNLTVVLSAVADKESGKIAESGGDMNRMYDWALCGVPRVTIDGLAERHGAGFGLHGR